MSKSANLCNNCPARGLCVGDVQLVGVAMEKTGDPRRRESAKRIISIMGTDQDLVTTRVAELPADADAKAMIDVIIDRAELCEGPAITETNGAVCRAAGAPVVRQVLTNFAHQ